MFCRLGFVVVALIPLSLMAEDKGDMLSVPAKKVPIPRTVSPQLDQFIAAPVLGAISALVVPSWSAVIDGPNAW